MSGACLLALRELAAGDDISRSLSASTDADGLPDLADTKVGRQTVQLYGR